MEEKPGMIRLHQSLVTKKNYFSQKRNLLGQGVGRGYHGRTSMINASTHVYNWTFCQYKLSLFFFMRYSV